MTYSELARRFQTVEPGEQVRVSDRVSYLYLEHVVLTQTDTGLVAYNRERKGAIQIPAGVIAVIILGPGCSVTHDAMRTCANSGCAVLFAGGGGIYAYSLARPLTASSRWAEAQAACWADPEARTRAAVALYRERFNALPQATSLAALRGIEGQMVKAEYARLRKKYGVSFKRDHQSEDPVNAGLNIGNSILYGLAASVCSSLSLNPALGIIHQGGASAFLFDLADVYKLDTTVPAAFASARQEDPAAYVRRRVRKAIVDEGVLEQMMELTMHLFAGYLPRQHGADGTVVLYDGDGKAVPSFRNYG